MKKTRTSSFRLTSLSQHKLQKLAEQNKITKGEVIRILLSYKFDTLNELINRRKTKKAENASEN